MSKRRKLKDWVDELIMWREYLFGQMDDTSTYSTWADNTPGVYDVWVLYINTTVALSESQARTSKRIRKVTNAIKSGDYQIPEIYFPSLFALSAFMLVAQPLLKEVAKRILKKEINKYKKLNKNE